MTLSTKRTAKIIPVVYECGKEAADGTTNEDTVTSPPRVRAAPLPPRNTLKWSFPSTTEPKLERDGNDPREKEGGDIDCSVVSHEEAVGDDSTLGDVAPLIEIPYLDFAPESHVPKTLRTEGGMDMDAPPPLPSSGIIATKTRRSKNHGAKQAAAKSNAVVGDSAAAPGVIGNATRLHAKHSSALSWAQRNKEIEHSILADVPEENLKPVTKALRSDKATMLLYGYMTEADRTALQSHAAVEGEAIEKDSMDGDASALPTPTSAQGEREQLRLATLKESGLVSGGIERSGAEVVAHFLQTEERLESERFRIERWSDKIALARSLAHFKKCFQTRFLSKTIADVATPLVRLRMRRWLEHSRRTRVIREAVAKANDGNRTAKTFPNIPSALLLKQTVPMMRDWPLRCIQEVLDSSTPEVYNKGDVIFHEGDNSKDGYIVLCGGHVEAVVMSGKFATKNNFVDAYWAQRKELAAIHKSSIEAPAHIHVATDQSTVAKYKGKYPYSNVVVDDIEGVLRDSNTAPVVPHWDDTRHRFAVHHKLVDSFLDNHVFGWDSVLTNGAPRVFTAVCRINGTRLLRIRRDDLYSCLSGVADLTRAVLFDASWQLRHNYVYGKVFPIPIDAFCGASKVFEHWHVNALQALMPHTYLQSVARGAELTKQNHVHHAGTSSAFYLLRGTIALSQEGVGVVQRLGPGSLFAAEDIVLSANPRRYTATVTSYYADVLVIPQDAFLAAGRDNGECGIASRKAVSKGIANRMIKPTKPPLGFCNEPLMHFIFPDHLLEELWVRYAENVFFLQGDSIFRAWDASEYVYLFISGTLFQQYTKEGPQVPITSYSDLQHTIGGSLQDDDIHQLQADAESAAQSNGDIYDALKSSGAFVRTVSATSSGGSPSKRHAKVTKQENNGDDRQWIPLERHLIAEEDQWGSVMLGTVELALSHPTYFSHVRATSNVVGWRWSQASIKRMLQDEHPAIWTALRLPQTMHVVEKRFREMSLRKLEDEASPRAAEPRQLNL